MTKTHPHIKAQALRDVANVNRANGDTVTAALIESAADMIEEQHADLAAAVEALEQIQIGFIGSKEMRIIARDTLARLTGGTKAEELESGEPKGYQCQS